MVLVVELVCYPVKGCAGVSLPDATVLAAGLAHDRSFMITDAGGQFRSQRTHPSLALIRPDISRDGGRLVLHAPGVEPITVHVAGDATRTVVSLFGQSYWGVDQGDAVGDWLSTVVGVPCRLVRVSPDHARVTSGHTRGTAGFADGHAVQLAAHSSLDELNTRILARGGVPVPMRRFRPNIVLDGWGEPHAEDRFRELTVGAVRLGYAKLDIRCAVTTVDQQAGARAGPEPLRTLATYRRAATGGVAFGVKAAVVGQGKLSVGDEVIVSSWGDSEL